MPVYRLQLKINVRWNLESRNRIEASLELAAAWKIAKIGPRRLQEAQEELEIQEVSKKQEKQETSKNIAKIAKSVP